MLGMKEDNADKIYFYSELCDMELVANNIFELIQKFQIEVYDFDHSNFDVNKFYRNWNEDFWRIKEK